jgi:DNA repair protein RadC
MDVNRCKSVLTFFLPPFLPPKMKVKFYKADIGLTNKCKEIGELLDIKILDHMIMTTEGYYSFAYEGMI